MVTLPLQSCHGSSFTLASTGEELSCAEVSLSQVSTGLSLAKLLGTNIQVLSIWLGFYCNYCRSMARHKEIHRVVRVVVTEILPCPPSPWEKLLGQQKGERQTSWAGSELLPALAMPPSLFGAWPQNISMLNSQCRLLFQEKTCAKPHSGQY